MPALPYPVASYPNDPLEIPVDPMTDIGMEIYHPGLIHHESSSGAQFFLRRGLPRWRGNASWAALYTNSERAGAMEGYLTSMSEGLYTSTLKHGRQVLRQATINKRGSGIGVGTIPAATQTIDGVLVTTKPGEVFKISSGDLSDRIFMVTSVSGNNITFVPDIDIFGNAGSVALNQSNANLFLKVRATPGSTINLPRNRTLSGPWNMSWIEGVL